jgi:acetyl esterase/lipase
VIDLAGHPSLRRALIVVATLIVVFGLPIGVDLASVQPGAAIVKAAFNSGPVVKQGPGFAAVKARVSVTPDIVIPAPGAPDAIIDVYVPKTPTSATRPMILWVHGGGFLSGSRRQVADYATMLADQDFTVASLEYSLAPGHQYPVPIRQGNAALSYLAANAARFGGDPAVMAVGGDSAGAQIASQLAALQTNPALAAAMRLTPAIPADHLKAAVLFCGLYDMDTVRDTGFPALRTFLWAYTGRRAWTTLPAIDQMSTTRQITDRYPATYLTVGDSDPFQPQAYELDATLRAHGVNVRSRYWTGTGAKLGHEYQFDFRTPAARTVFTDTVAFLNDHRK